MIEEDGGRGRKSGSISDLGNGGAGMSSKCCWTLECSTHLYGRAGLDRVEEDLAQYSGALAAHLGTLTVASRSCSGGCSGDVLYKVPLDQADEQVDLLERGEGSERGAYGARWFPADTQVVVVPADMARFVVLTKLRC